MNGWTGGQYSVYRVVLGAYLLQHFAGLLAWGPELFSSEGMLADATLSPLYPLFPNVLFALDSPIVVTLLLGLAAIAAVLFAAGFKDRACALVLWYLWACLFTRNPLIQNPSLPFIGWLLIAHSVLPRAPYGSWDARGRADPGGGWQLPDSIYAGAWIVMAIGYSYSGYTKLVSPSWVDGSAIAHILDNPLARPSFVRDLALALPTPVLQLMTWGGLALELLFAPLALVRRVRPWLWLAMLGLHLNLLVLIDFADLSFGMVILHAFTFDPSWLRARRSAGEWVVYYDGSCGLCHRTVRLLLAEDREAVFRYAPLESARFANEVAPSGAGELPDSIVLRTPDGELRVRSAALIEIGDQLGGVWRALAIASRAVPRVLRDRLYDQIAAIRQRLFRRPEQACPIVPPDLRERFSL